MINRRPLDRSDSIPMREVAELQSLIITYNRITDAVELDDVGLSRLEVRGILSLALETVADVSEEM